ncbi:TetR/AcrR family transcriptional regulator [Actinoallomurus sp. NBC_01490]|jgi:AcrR family transcriptional regulator|uniref:TetR/AcrR family transcriptional regulator n=1 Tax=Actinoallomurus sp. NBC_01490 TaxID=2903557 RepID=UPI002E2F30CE|nr:TetR/AcrR family transcriptional regulator [Actinoallomurus sp. NBC_01490]
MVRVRLDTDQRREQLLRVGIELLGTQPVETLSVGTIARAAGVSKGLLYHYFHDREEFLVAVVWAATEELVAATEPDVSLPPLRQLEHAIDGLITYAEEHAIGYAALVEGRIGIPGVAEVTKAQRERRVASFVDHIARMSPADLETVRGSAVLRTAIDGQLTFLHQCVLRWLEHRDMDRATLHRLLVNAFLMAMLAANSVDPRLRFDALGASPSFQAAVAESERA